MSEVEMETAEASAEAPATEPTTPPKWPRRLMKSTRRTEMFANSLKHQLARTIHDYNVSEEPTKIRTEQPKLSDRRN